MAAVEQLRQLTSADGATTVNLGDAADGLAGIMAFELTGTWSTAGTITCDGSLSGTYYSLAIRKQDDPDTVVTSIASGAQGIYYVDASCLRLIRLSVPLLTGGTLHIYRVPAIG